MPLKEGAIDTAGNRGEENLTARSSLTQANNKTYQQRYLLLIAKKGLVFPIFLLTQNISATSPGILFPSHSTSTNTFI